MARDVFGQSVSLDDMEMLEHSIFLSRRFGIDGLVLEALRSEYASHQSYAPSVISPESPSVEVRR